MHALIRIWDNAMWQQRIRVKDGICATHMLAIFLDRKGNFVTTLRERQQRSKFKDENSEVVYKLG